MTAPIVAARFPVQSTRLTPSSSTQVQHSMKAGLRRPRSSIGEYGASFPTSRLARSEGAGSTDVLPSNTRVNAL